MAMADRKDIGRDAWPVEDPRRSRAEPLLLYNTRSTVPGSFFSSRDCSGRSLEFCLLRPPLVGVFSLSGLGLTPLHFIVIGSKCAANC